MSRRKFTFFVRHLRHHESYLTTGIVLTPAPSVHKSTKPKNGRNLSSTMGVPEKLAFHYCRTHTRPIRTHRHTRTVVSGNTNSNSELIEKLRFIGSSSAVPPSREYSIIVYHRLTSSFRSRKRGNGNRWNSLAKPRGNRILNWSKIGKPPFHWIAKSRWTNIVVFFFHWCFLPFSSDVSTELPRIDKIYASETAAVPQPKLQACFN